MFNQITLLSEALIDDSDFINLTDSNFARKEFFVLPKQLIKKQFNKYLSNRKYEPTATGDINAKIALAKYYNGKGITADKSDYIITASTSEAYNIIFQTFSKGFDEALIPSPSYPLFSYLLKFNRISESKYTLNKDMNWEINVKEFEDQITKRTHFLILINPNNPTGSFIPQKVFDELIKICQKNKIFMILDEVFSPYTNQMLTFPPRKLIQTPIFVLNGISKMFALPDLKVGWIFVYSSDNSTAIDKLETTNDVYLNCTTFSQSLIPILMDNLSEIQAPIIKRLANNRKIISSFFKSNSASFKFNGCDNGIHVFFGIKRNRLDEERFVIELLKAEKVLIHPGYFYDFEDKSYNWFTFSYLISPKALTLALNRIKKFTTNFVS